MNCKGLCSGIFGLFCFSGFVFQMQQVSELYFRYETTTKTVYVIREIDYYQTIIYCPMAVNLLNRTDHKAYGLFRKPHMSAPMDELAKLTIKDILELTPSASNVIESCTIRQGQVSVPHTMGRDACKSFFKVIKSVNGERICYTFKPRILANYSVAGVASSQTWTCLIYQIYLMPSISKSHIAFFISSVTNPKNDLEDLKSRPYQARIYNLKTLRTLGISVFGESIDINRLLPPYDTNCSPGHNSETCYEVCLIDKFKKIHKIPWSGLHREKLNMKMLTLFDLENNTVSKFTSRTFSECHNKCRLKTECLTEFSRTTIQEYQRASFAISSMLPSFPHISIYTVPFLNLIEYIVQVGSCFGVWFGLSIISFNPTKWKIMQKKISAPRTIVNIRPKKIFIFSRIRHSN